MTDRTLHRDENRPTYDPSVETQWIGRRSILKNGILVLGAASVGENVLLAEDSISGQDAAPLRIGMVTDLHYADKPPAGSRHYRETPDKLAEAAEKFGQNRPSFIVELGDLIDAADSVATERSYLKTINKTFSAICEDRHYVLGNHCVDTLYKEEFLGAVGQPSSYYSFDRGNFHFIVLDSCFRSDGQPYGRKNFKWTDANLPLEELEWLKSDLAETKKPTIVFAHQRLDVKNNHGVKNNEEARRIFESSKKVLAVFQGHSHQNDLKEIGGIHYCTLVAMVEGSGKENSGYSIMEIDPSGTIRLSGFRKQKHYNWPA